jgi:two-component system response regulator NreC
MIRDKVGLRLMTRTKVLIADDHALIRSGLRVLLERESEFEVVAEAADGYEAIERAEQSKPEVALLDVGMPRLNGIDAAQQISEKLPSVRVIILSMHSDEGYVLRALKAGAKGYLLKASTESDVLRAVRAVAAGQAYFSPEISRVLAEEYVREIRSRGVQDSYDLLSIREKEILQLLVTGKSNREIADLIHVSHFTVETHRNNIFQKLHLHSLPELILYAVRKGLIS